MKKEIKDILELANQHFVEKFANGDFTISYQSEVLTKVECDGDIFWLWTNDGVDGLISILDNPIRLNLPVDVREKVYKTITKSDEEEEEIQREIKTMEDKLEELKKRLEKISK